MGRFAKNVVGCGCRGRDRQLSDHQSPQCRASGGIRWPSSPKQIVARPGLRDLGNAVGDQVDDRFAGVHGDQAGFAATISTIRLTGN
jgi:hypothetical protein